MLAHCPLPLQSSEETLRVALRDGGAVCCFPSFAPLSVWYFLWLPASAVQQDAVVGRQAQAGTRAGNHQRHTHRRETSAHQRRQTTPHIGKQLNTPKRATSPSGRLYCAPLTTALPPKTREPPCYLVRGRRGVWACGHRGVAPAPRLSICVHPGEVPTLASVGAVLCLSIASQQDTTHASLHRTRRQGGWHQ